MQRLQIMEEWFAITFYGHTKAEGGNQIVR